MIFSKTGEILEVNDFTIKRVGLSRDELLKQNAIIFFQKNPEITIEQILKELESSDLFTFNLDYYGSEMLLEVNVKKIHYH